jgi:hypothetical protein
VIRDDRGSMPMALLLTLVGTSLSALLVPMVVTQVGTTREDAQRVHALHAAEAGLDVALSHIRAAVDASGNGVMASLPCGPFTGRVGVAGTARYQVSVDYLPSDPRGQSSAWVTTNRIRCVAGAGTITTPVFALLRADGTDRATGAFGTSESGRTLAATYTFQTTTANVSGGLVHVYRTSGADLCLDAGSASPAPGANLQVKTCDPTSDAQKFAYQSNLTLVLVSSKTSMVPLGRCLDAGSPHVANNPVQFQACPAVTTPRQQWSINDSSNFEGTTDGVTLDGYCLNVQTPGLAGSFVVLGSVAAGRCRAAYDTRQTFLPEAAVGAGAAGPAAGQVVNYNQFGRCLDVTEQNVAFAYMIVWPCKQAPNPANVSWNQKWALPALGGAQSATGKITTNPGTLYCLRSPGSVNPGQYVTTVACPGPSTPANASWTVYGNTGNYATSYRIQDSFGYCLSATNPDAVPADLYPNGLRTSKVVVATCDGSTMQKWNAPANLMRSQALKDVAEK